MSTVLTLTSTSLSLLLFLLAPASALEQDSSEPLVDCAVSDPPPPSTLDAEELDLLEQKVDTLLAEDRPWHALRLGRTILRRRTELLGPLHPSTINSLEVVAAIFEEADELSSYRRGARNLWLEAYRRRGALPFDDRRRKARDRAATLAIEFDDHATAIELLREMLDDPWTSEARALRATLQLATCLSLAGRHAEALPIAEELAMQTLDSRGPDERSLAAMLLSSSCLLRAGLRFESEFVWLRATFIHQPMLVELDSAPGLARAAR